MNLQQLTVDAFAVDGMLSSMSERFVSREGQTEMAKAVADVVANGGALVVEAGTGTGKTFAYLVPALLSGKRVLVSTATKTLQDQLHGRDIPALAEHMGLPIKLALLKGRSSYLCVERLEGARQGDGGGIDKYAARTLARIERWALSTRTGDLAEIEGLDERSSAIAAVTSTRENCLGSECSKYRSCYVYAARREALGADVVVVNHHLFFADMSVRESGMAELLPSVDVVILDEAHQLNETGIQFLGAVLSSHQALDLAHDALASGLQHARGLCEWQALAASLENAMRDLRLAAGPSTRSYGGKADTVRLNWTAQQPNGLNEVDWTQALVGLRTATFELHDALATVSELNPELARLQTRAKEFLERCDAFTQTCPVDSVRWLDVNQQLRLVQSPLDIAEALKKRVWKPPETAPTSNTQTSTEPERRAWIFTSATLGDDDRLSWFTEACGLDAATVLRVSSPFDYAAQAGVFVPRDFPEPSDPSHSHAVAALAAKVALVLGGRTMVLTTTLRALNAVSEALRQHLPESIAILVQGTLPKRELIERFRSFGDSAGQANGMGEQGAVLVGSASFWEGVDLPGEALQAVFIDKLPFPPPSDPLVQARSLRLQQQGKNPFAAYQLAEAAVALKQGAGRLIRHETDQGALIVTDRRLAVSSYGRRLMAALPPMQVLNDESELLAWLGRVRG